MHSFNNQYKAKLFLSRTYLYPSFFYTTTYSGKTQINPQLKPAHINNLVTEVSKTRKKYTVSLGLLYADFEDAIFYDPTVRQYKNSINRSNLLSTQFKLKYHFDLFNSLNFNVYKSINSNHYVYSSDSGATLRLLNNYNKFNFFNEIVYRSDYVSSNNTIIDSGYDYSFGFIYEYNKKLSFNFKAENILNKAIEAPITILGAVNNIDRTILFGMEYNF